MVTSVPPLRVNPLLRMEKAMRVIMATAAVVKITMIIKMVKTQKIPAKVATNAWN
jgi:hypothetical protein